jgi:hypothetical protein
MVAVAAIPVTTAPKRFFVRQATRNAGMDAAK